ncbi:hypothetical protein AGLY_014545 [Aphis glycines]|uniref:Uncharacterized protein n=1 Tax=Aphis glycines TaxID=307491 RepID=A0A6G0T5D9_APHGL|nr:hypothetical protein AGLY_014545 [Aphis glycines]
MTYYTIKIKNVQLKHSKLIVYSLQYYNVAQRVYYLLCTALTPKYYFLFCAVSYLSSFLFSYFGFDPIVNLIVLFASLTADAFKDVTVLLIKFFLFIILNDSSSKVTFSWNTVTLEHSKVFLNHIWKVSTKFFLNICNSSSLVISFASITVSLLLFILIIRFSSTVWSKTAGDLSHIVVYIALHNFFPIFTLSFMTPDCLASSTSVQHTIKES